MGFALGVKELISVLVVTALAKRETELLVQLTMATALANSATARKGESQKQRS